MSPKRGSLRVVVVSLFVNSYVKVVRARICQSFDSA